MALARAASIASARRLPLPSPALRVSAASASSTSFWLRSLAQPRQLVDLQPPHGGVFDLQHVDRRLVDRLVLVDADHRLLAGVDPGLRLGGGFLDPQFRHAGLDRLRHAAELLDLLDMAPGLGGEIAGQPLDIIGAAPGIDDAVGAALLLQEQLRVAGDARGEIGRQRQRLVERVGVQRLGVALRRRHRLDGGAHHVVVDVLRGQRPARGLAMRAQRQRARVLRIELLQQLGPQQPRGAHLGDLHEEVHADRPEERQPRREAVDVEAGGEAGAEIFDAVGQRIGELEVLRRAGFLHVIAGDRDRIVFRHLLRGVGKDVGDDPHRGRRRIDVGVAHHELFQNVVLNGAREFFRRHALFLGGRDEQRQDRQHRAVHGHRHAHLVERDAGEQRAHVVDRIDRDAGHADVAGDARMIAVVAAMGGEIERDREALLPGGEVAAIERVGIFRRGEPGILPDGPGLVDIHGRVGAAQIGRDAGPGLEEVDAFEIGFAVAGLYQDALGRQPRLGAAGRFGAAVFSKAIFAKFGMRLMVSIIAHAAPGGRSLIALSASWARRFNHGPDAGG